MKADTMHTPTDSLAFCTPQPSAQKKVYNSSSVLLALVGQIIVWPQNTCTYHKFILQDSHASIKTMDGFGTWMPNPLYCTWKVQSCKVDNNFQDPTQSRHVHHNVHERLSHVSLD